MFLLLFLNTFSKWNEKEITEGKTDFFRIEELTRRWSKTLECAETHSKLL